MRNAQCGAERLASETGPPEALSHVTCSQGYLFESVIVLTPMPRAAALGEKSLQEIG